MTFLHSLLSAIWNWGSRRERLKFAQLSDRLNSPDRTERQKALKEWYDYLHLPEHERIYPGPWL